MYTEIKAKLNAALEHNIATRDASLNKEELYDRYAHELEWLSIFAESGHV